MSAIAGVYLLDGCSVDEKDLKRMNDSMPHRGPDGSGLWHDGPVGLAHQMLWTTPESLHEKLPFEADGLVITSDSRIDNREELLPELGLSEEVSDSEVILKAYGRWGKSCVDRLLGDFAFVIWDKAKEELFCARDHMGVRPFYYYYMPGEIFAFGTEIKAIFAWGVSREINDVRIGDYLARIVEDKEITFYLNISRLPPANMLILGHEGLRNHQYWELDPKREILMKSDADYEKIFGKIFNEAVKCRTRSAFPLGSTLSGGLDSSSIVCEMRKILPDSCPLKTFSIIFDTVNQCDERYYINSILKKYYIESHFVYGDKMGPLVNIEKMLWHKDQPFIGFNIYHFWALSEKACNEKVRVLFSGIGGDSVVSHGDGYITELAGKGQLFSMMNEVLGLSNNFGLSPWRVFLNYAIYPYIPLQMSKLWHLLLANGNLFRKNFSIIDPEFAKRIGLLERKKKLLKAHSRRLKTAKDMHWQDLANGVHQIVFEEINIVAAAFSVEITHPFFDKRLVEFCLALPTDQKIRLGWTRYIMRRALKDILPVEIYSRGDKTDLSQNFSFCLLKFHKKSLKRELFDKQITLSKYVNISKLHESFMIFKSTEGCMDLWIAANLSLWLRSFDAQSLYEMKEKELT